jgi:hypothetical protein
VVGYLSTVTGSFLGGVLYLSLSALIAAALVFSIRATKPEKMKSVPGAVATGPMTID